MRGAADRGAGRAVLLALCLSRAAWADGIGRASGPGVTPLPPVYSVDASAPPPGMHAQGPLPTSPEPPRAEVGSVEEGNGAQYQSIQAGGSEVLLIDLGSAWRLAARQNPTIGLARQVVAENLALLLQSRVIAVPSLNAGTSYHLHNGALQPSAGEILDVPQQQALYVGGGAQTVGSQTIGIPAVQIYAPLADVFYMPLAVRQELEASNFDVRATYNAILLDVTTAYLGLVRAEASFAAYRRSEIDMADVLRPTVEFAASGKDSMPTRIAYEPRRSMLRGQSQMAEGNIAVAAAELSKLLQLNPSVSLRTPAGPLALVSIVDPNDSLFALVAVALRYRPEMGAATSEIAAADVRFRQERIRPVLPTIALGFSAGTFGGGSELVAPPLFGNFSGRSDFDVMALWTLMNAGAGNASLRNRRRASAARPRPIGRSF